MLSDGKTRINVTLSDEVIARLDAYSKAMGLNRSALCCYMIGQQVMVLDKTLGIADAVSKSLVKAIDDSDIANARNMVGKV